MEIHAVDKPVDSVDIGNAVGLGCNKGVGRRKRAADGRSGMYSGTMVDDLINMVQKAEREAETREMLEGELAQARVYTLIWNVPTPTQQRYL
jgi:hypothetical protein